MVPFLKKMKITYFDPQVEYSSREQRQLELEAKENSEVLLFVIDPKVRAMASLMEAVEYGLRGRDVIVVVNDIMDGTLIDGKVITGQELEDLNRARAYLRDMVDRCHTMIRCDTLDRVMILLTLRFKVK
jgi:hypothetical protein